MLLLFLSFVVFVVAIALISEETLECIQKVLKDLDKGRACLYIYNIVESSLDPEVRLGSNVSSISNIMKCDLGEFH